MKINFFQTCLVLAMLFTTQSSFGAYKVKQIQHATSKGCDGSIDLLVEGNSGPYKVNWTGPENFRAPAPSQSKTSLSNLCSGTYSIEVTNRWGCAVLSEDIKVVHFFGRNAQRSLIEGKVVPACGKLVPQEGYQYTDRGMIELYETEAICDLLKQEDKTWGDACKLSYVWTNDAIGSSIKNLAVGTYCVEAWISNGKQKSLIETKCFEVEMEFRCGAGRGKTIEMESEAISSTLEVYPNPFKEDITVALNLSTSGQVEFTLYDLLGKVVQQKAIELTSGEWNYTLSTKEDLPIGIYNLEVQLPGLENKLIKLVKTDQ